MRQKSPEPAPSLSPHQREILAVRLLFSTDGEPLDASEEPWLEGSLPSKRSSNLGFGAEMGFAI